MIAALLLAAATPAVPPPAIAPGIYSDVRMSEATGDLGGIELRIDRADDGALTVAAVWCQGWCNSIVEAPLTRAEDGYAFDFQEPIWSAGEETAGPVYRMSLRPDGKALALMVSGEGIDPSERRRLKRIDKPFGLAVAAMETAAD